MANNKFMGTFDNESEVLRKIEELKNQGISEDHMYVMAHDKEQLSMVRGRTDVDYKSAEGGWMDKFMGFLSGNEPVREAFSGMGVDEKEADSYYRDVQNGKILFFVDQEIGSNYDANDNDIDRNVYGDPGKNATGGTSVNGDSGMVARDGLTVDTNESNDVSYHRERGERGLADDDDLAAKPRQRTDETAGVGKKKVQDTETVRETVRKEEADIDEGAPFKDKNKKDITLSDLDDDDFDGNRREHF